MNRCNYRSRYAFAAATLAIALVLGSSPSLAAQTPPRAAQPAQQSPQTWRATIKENGWTWNASGDDDASLQFVRPAPKLGEYDRIWVRYESRATQTDGGMAYRSAVALMEADCKQGRSRNLQVTRYAGNNLSGKSDQYLVRYPEWAYATPGTLAQAELDAACDASTFDGAEIFKDGSGERVGTAP